MVNLWIWINNNLSAPASWGDIEGVACLAASSSCLLRSSSSSCLLFSSFNSNCNYQNHNIKNNHQFTNKHIQTCITYKQNIFRLYIIVALLLPSCHMQIELEEKPCSVYVVGVVLFELCWCGVAQINQQSWCWLIWGCDLFLRQCTCLCRIVQCDCWQVLIPRN